MIDVVPVLLVEDDSGASSDVYGRHTDASADDAYLVVRGVERSVAERTRMQIVEEGGDAFSDDLDDIAEGETRIVDR